MSTLAPFGTYAPTSWQQRVINITRQLPSSWLGRRLALWLRKPVLKGVGTQAIDSELLGFRMRLLPYDNVSEKRVLFTPHFFDADELRLLEQRLTPDFKFLDIGANAGIYSLFVGARTSVAASIVAVEPQPEMLTRLRTNIALNGFSTIRVMPLALSDRAGTIDLHLSADNRGQASVTTEGGTVVTVATKTLLGLMDEVAMTQADAMKIDIEGAEALVLGAFFATAPRNRWPKLIFIERNQAKWQMDIVMHMLQLGYAERTPGRMNAILELK
jgi:FkbM family methyltransferase